MDIPQKYWQKTKIHNEINLFPAAIGEFLSGKKAISVKRARTFLPYILWRWYFLENKNLYEISPYFHLEFKKREEKWPKDGLFLPLASMQLYSHSKYKVNINLEYINFLEQPLIADAQTIKLGQKPQYNFGAKYLNDCQFFSQHLPNSPLSQELVIPLIKKYIQHNLCQWYKKDLFLQDAFSLESWLYFWKEVWQDIIKSNPQNPYCTDQFWSKYSQRLQQILPDLDFNTFLEKAEKDKNKDNEFIGKIFYHLWLSLAYYLLVPSSLFLNIMAPVFIDQQQFDYDTQDLLTHSYKEPIPFYAACTNILPTSFGKLIKELR